MAHTIDHGWWTACSACGGNAHPDDASHVRGGPDRGGNQGPNNPRSTLSNSNGCGALFDEPPTVDTGVQYTPPAEVNLLDALQRAVTAAKQDRKAGGSGG